MRKSVITTSFLLIATLLAPVTVQAHAILVKSQPAKDEEVTESPKQISVWFNEGVRSEYKALAVIDSEGRRVDNHDVEQSLTDSSNLTASVPPLAPGVYTVRYRVVSKDTHIVTGKFNFTVKAP
ncbi:MAG: copper resistance protein CopC [Methylomonas sp.]|nr:copper resistance protein CopC [Methylomonas sp.]PPD22214.1 MAG: copper resistance protein CopC [Methylomonas sp.]PPD27751.1 MAG: copper resistance protein CopC [Methylomonas sp.]PPD39762.1 MAG: copper resistance protein CopC [Methylomonas sp.]PPD42535.1 MAG: copper resistance protein CopC [Methylomonas sp.]